MLVNSQIYQLILDTEGRFLVLFGDRKLALFSAFGDRAQRAGFPSCGNTAQPHCIFAAFSLEWKVVFSITGLFYKTSSFSIAFPLTIGVEKPWNKMTFINTYRQQNILEDCTDADNPDEPKCPDMCNGLCSMSSMDLHPKERKKLSKYLSPTVEEPTWYYRYTKEEMIGINTHKSCMIEYLIKTGTTIKTIKDMAFINHIPKQKNAASSSSTHLTSENQLETLPNQV